MTTVRPLSRQILRMAGAGTDISDATATEPDVLAGKTFYAGSTPKKTGTMTDNGTVSTDITTKAQEVTIAAGKHSGAGIVKISSVEQAKIIATNIKKDVTILGITGTLETSPAIICPANGYLNPNDPPNFPYIPNPLLPADGWNLLCQFQTNSGNATTFDPTITKSSGDYAWDLGDGTIIKYDLAISHTYADSTTKTVKLYGKGTCNITIVDFNADNIVGTIDLSNNTFKSLTTVQLYGNASLTGITMPSVMTSTFNNFSAYQCNITGTLNLSMITAWTGTGTIQVHYNSLMTAVTLPSSATGAMATLQFSFTGVSSLNLSAFSALYNGASIQATDCPSLTRVTFASTITSGYITNLSFTSSNLTGTLDLSMFKSFNTAGAGSTIALRALPNLTGVTFTNQTITGLIGMFTAYSSGLTGNLNLSKLNRFTANATVELYSCPNLTGVTFSTPVTGNINTLSIYGCNSLTTIDLSPFTSFAASSTLVFYNNPNLVNLIFSPTTWAAGSLYRLSVNNCPKLGYVDLSKLGAGLNAASMQITFNGDGWSAASVNNLLYVVNSIISSGYASRTINLAGTGMVAPDTTSGGYDGVAAKAAIIAKGVSVTTN